MSAEPFNSLGGYTVGIPPVAVIDSNGNVVSNFLNLSGNVSANKVYASGYYYANGAPFTGAGGSPGGTNTQLQFNSAGTFGGIPNVTWNGNILSLGDISALSISGGSDGFFLQTDGNGNLTWAAGGGGGNGSPGGSNRQVQFNDSGLFGGSANYTFNKLTSTLTVTGNIISNTYIGNYLGNASLTTLSANSTVDFSNSGNVTFGDVADMHIFGGVNGYVLSTDGAGNLSWIAGGGGGNGSPGGSNTQVQYNDSGTFGGSPFFTFNEATTTLNVAGDLIANAMTIGSGVYKFSRSNVYFATTSTMANTPLISMQANSVASVDYTIVATNQTAGHRQVSKVSAVMYESTCNYTEYSTLNVNGFVGNFTVGYSPGNIITPPSVTLYVEPIASTLSVYKIQMTVYEA